MGSGSQSISFVCCSNNLNFGIHPTSESVVIRDYSVTDLFWLMLFPPHLWFRQKFCEGHSWGRHSTCVSLFMQWELAPQATSRSSEPAKMCQQLKTCSLTVQSRLQGSYWHSQIIMSRLWWLQPIFFCTKTFSFKTSNSVQATSSTLGKWSMNWGVGKFWVRCILADGFDSGDGNDRISKDFVGLLKIDEVFVDSAGSNAKLRVSLCCSCAGKSALTREGFCKPSIVW